jgi:hypothetical protein
MFRQRNRIAFLLAALALALGLAAWTFAGGGRAKQELGLFTTLPIYWAEAGNMASMLDKQAKPNWARGRLERRYDLVPLDTLGKDGKAGDGLAGVELLMMAQPRALSPSENVALDDWVRAGGRVLVFADPLLIMESQFALGDRRRPQGAVLLSPILRRWGLDLQFDPDQPAGERLVETDLAPLPVDMAGALHPADGFPTSEEDCWIAYDRVFARCAIGKGRAVIVADAALFETADGEAMDRRHEALDWLTASAFGERK